MFVLSNYQLSVIRVFIAGGIDLGNKYSRVDRQVINKSYFQTLEKWGFKGLITCDLVANLFINVIWLFVESHGNFNLNRFDFFSYDTAWPCFHGKCTWSILAHLYYSLATGPT